MAWSYKQSNGYLFNPYGGVLAVGYSGHGDGKNNPAMQHVHNVGPIPRGMWRMASLRLETKSHGPFVIVLEPSAETETFGRSGFLVHGDAIAAPGTASEGCIIQARLVREQLWGSDDHDIEVIA